MAKTLEVTLNSEKTMPVIGYGTAANPPIDYETSKAAIVTAIKVGYRHFDTAFIYGSEKILGEAIAEALRLGIIKSRNELFITTKLWASFAEQELVLPALKMSLSNLQLDYVDLFLIHWPLKLSQENSQMHISKQPVFSLDVKSVWKGMEECITLDLAKAIGVSNLPCKMLEELLSISKIPPATNQVEMNPFWQQRKLREFCKAKGIHITAYSPLGGGKSKWGENRIIESDVLEEIAKAKGKTIAQISLRWVYEQGVSLVTKSYNKERMKENLEIFDWSLTKEESNKINQLPQRKGFTFAAIFGPHDLVLELDAML